MSRTTRCLVLSILAIGCGAAPSDPMVGDAPIGSRRAALGYLEQAVLTGLGQTSDQYSYAVAISGDTALVGAPYEDVPASNCGAAYVYTRSGGVWSLQQQLSPGSSFSGDTFGQAVSLDGDTAVVSAPGYGSTGAAFVYTRTAGVWTLQQTLTPIATFIGFGRAAAISGDMVAVGAYLSDGPTNAGSVYAYARSGGSWSLLGQLVASDAQTDDQLGWSVAVAGSTVLAGAPYNDQKGSNAGAAYAFTYDGAAWSEQKLTAADAAAGDHFGLSVAITASPLVGQALLIGSPDDDDLGSESGAAYLFTGSPGGHAQTQKILPGDGAAVDHFGAAVAIDEGGAVIGAPHDDDVAANAGAAYIYAGGALLSERQKVHASDGGVSHFYGQAAGIDGATAILGAPGAFGNTGSAYLQSSTDTCVTLMRTPAQPAILWDSYIAWDPTDPTKANGNFGATTSLHTGALGTGYRQGLLGFDLSVLPPGAALTLERLFLRKANSLGTGTVNVHAISAPWAENTLTWNAFAGAYDPAVIASFQPSLIPNGSDILLDLLGISLPHGVLLDEPASGRVQIGASEAGSVASRPRLLVCYQ